MDVVLEGLPVHSGALVAVALVLVLPQSDLQNNHAQRPDVALVGVAVRLSGLQLQGLGEFRREVDVRSGAFGDEGVVVGGGAGADGVVDLDDAVLRDEDGVGAEGLVLDGLLLEVAEAEDAAGEDGPELLLLEAALLEVALVDLVLQGAVGELEERVYLVEGGAVLVLRLGEQLLQPHHVLAVPQLRLPPLQQLHVPLELPLVVERELPQQLLRPRAPALQVQQSLVLHLLHHLVVPQQRFVVAALRRGRGSRTHSNYNQMQNEYHSIRVDPEHEQLLAKHKDLICASYKIEGGELKILEVEAKIGEHTGVYYRMTIRDSNRKTYKIKIEKPKTQDL